MLPHSFDTGIIVYGIGTAFLALFINYIIQPGEIFGGYSVMLSKRKLKALGQWEQYSGMIRNADNKNYLMDAHRLMKEAAEPYFTWEKAAGMCAACCGFWISLVCGIFYTLDPVTVAGIILTAHITIRIISKIL